MGLPSDVVNNPHESGLLVVFGCEQNANCSARTPANNLDNEHIRLPFGGSEFAPRSVNK